MADDSGNDGSSPTPGSTRTRKVRPEIQIYRPGTAYFTGSIVIFRFIVPILQSAP